LLLASLLVDLRVVALLRVVSLSCLILLESRGLTPLSLPRRLLPSRLLGLWLLLVVELVSFSFLLVVVVVPFATLLDIFLSLWALRLFMYFFSFSFSCCSFTAARKGNNASAITPAFLILADAGEVGEVDEGDDDEEGRSGEAGAEDDSLSIFVSLR